MHKRKILYVSDSRSDFGLMISVLNAIEKSEKLQLLIYITGMHLMSEFGNTGKEVELQFTQVRKLNAVYKTDDREGIVFFMSTYLDLFVQAIQEDRPELVLLTGDRAEILATAAVCTYLGIPIAHVHGGEKTTTVDETVRHAVSKLAHIHFVASEDSAKRLRKMGEDAWRINVTGAPALDTIHKADLLSREKVYEFLQLDAKKQFILLIYHPVSEAIEQAAKQMREIITAVIHFALPVIIIFPNADPGGRCIITEIEKLNNENIRIYPSVPYEIFLAIAREAAVWIGNSSAGIIESASFRTPVVNIGDRQNGRISSGNLIDVDCKSREIITAIQTSLFDESYRRKLKKVKNIWGDGNAAPRIVRIIEDLKIDSVLLHKQITY